MGAPCSKEQAIREAAPTLAQMVVDLRERKAREAEAAKAAS